MYTGDFAFVVRVGAGVDRRDPMLGDVGGEKEREQTHVYIAPAPVCPKTRVKENVDMAMWRSSGSWSMSGGTTPRARLL